MSISRPAGTYRDDYGIAREWDGTAWIHTDDETWFKYPASYTGDDGIKLGWDGTNWVNLDKLSEIYKVRAETARAKAMAAATSSETGKPLPRVGTPGSTIQSTKQRKPLGCGIWALIIFLVVAAISIAAGQNQNPDVAEQADSIVACQKYVRENLKAPSTADFQVPVAVKVSNGVWAVTGTVDAQNSFGAKIRNSYKCTVTSTKDTISTKIDYLQ